MRSTRSFVFKFLNKVYVFESLGGMDKLVESWLSAISHLCIYCSG